MKRLNLGDILMVGWDNIPFQEVVVGDEGVSFGTETPIRSLPEGRYDEIYAGHLLDRVPPPNTAGLLEKVQRALAPGGKLHATVWDFRKIVSLYMKSECDLDDVHLHYIWGSRKYGDPILHRQLWDQDKLFAALGMAHFVGICPIDMPSFPYTDLRQEGECGFTAYRPAC